MMSVTHAALAVCTVAIGVGTADPYVLAAAAVASQLPDIDTSESSVGRVCWPVTNFLEQRFPHRSMTHSFMATGAIALLSLPLLWWGRVPLYLAVVVGYFVGWFADAFTKSGVEAFYPNPARLVIPGNPRARLDTRSPSEYWVLATAIFLTVAAVNIASAGGISETVAKTFFNDPATAAELFHKYGAEQRVVATVEGIHIYTSQAVSDRYELIGATTTDITGVSLTTGVLHKIGNGSDIQIRPTRVKAELTGMVRITSQNLAIQEMAAVDWLTTLPQNAFISGSLLLDDIDELQIPLNLENYPSVRTWGGQLELSNARPLELASLLRDYWILNGQVIVKVRA
ncbi:hypothetical protein C7271_15850 [filamentous cyanobacterium CCP5]|nr:hypothetical protein C7271_15850 [filamentous cyanobacterium CCP5]